MEPVKAELNVARLGVKKATLLDHDGLPTGRALPLKDGRLTVDGTRDQTPYYLLER